MNSAFRHPGCSTGEVKNGHIFRVGGGDCKLIRSFSHQPGPGVQPIAGVFIHIGQKDILKLRQALPETGDFLFVQPLGRDQNFSITPVQALVDGFWPKSRKERTEDTGIL
jgi:hypothetical protein